MLMCSHIPPGFCSSYTVPLPKVKDCRTAPVTCDDFRGIAISSVLSKVFEHCILDRFRNYFSTNDNQFGFKKNLSCSHAIFTINNIVGRFVSGGSTVNLCAVDLSKAFDRINHHALLLKLIKRHLPNNLLDILDLWLSNSWSCVKWLDTFSNFFKIELGVRQGSVLSPFLFAVYLDEIVDHRVNGIHNYVILYADDILLLSPSLSDLQRMFTACETELTLLDMTINVKKSCCLRIGPRFEAGCSNIITVTGTALPWVKSIRYLGIYIVNARSFKCSLDNAKRSFHRSTNAIFGKIGRIASEEVTLHLVTSKCLPVLLYGLEACHLTKSDIRSMDFMFNRFLMRLFKTNKMEIIQDCINYFNIKLPSTLLNTRYERFLVKYRVCENFFCSSFAKT
jgi:hypothetical protein